MKPSLPIALAAALILLGGAVHGHRTNRWGLPPELLRSAERLPDLPLSIGDWEGQDIEADETLTGALEKGEISAFLQRYYVHRRTGEVVTVFLALGPTGAMVTHDPRACYGGGGIRQLGPLSREAVPVEADGRPADFLIGNFRPTNSANPMGVRIYWSFRSGDRWEASEDPRGDFARHRALYKIYALREVPLSESGGVPDSVSPEFLRALLPELERSVFQAHPARG